MYTINRRLAYGVAIPARSGYSYAYSPWRGVVALADDGLDAARRRHHGRWHLLGLEGRMNGVFAIVGLLSFGVAAAAMSFGVMHALDVKYDAEIRETAIAVRRDQSRRDHAALRRERRLAELTFWDYEQRVRPFERELEARRRERRARRK